MSGFSSNMRTKLVGLRRIILVFILFFARTRMMRTSSSYVVHMKQNKDAVWSLVLLSVPGVRADPKYSYSYDTICMYVRIVTFDFALKYFLVLVGTW